MCEAYGLRDLGGEPAMLAGLLERLLDDSALLCRL